MFITRTFGFIMGIQISPPKAQPSISVYFLTVPIPLLICDNSDRDFAEFGASMQNNYNNALVHQMTDAYWGTHPGSPLRFGKRANPEAKRLLNLTRSCRFRVRIRRNTNR